MTPSQVMLIFSAFTSSHAAGEGEDMTVDSLDCKPHGEPSVYQCDNCDARMCPTCIEEGDAGGDRDRAGTLTAYPTLCPACYAAVQTP